MATTTTLPVGLVEDGNVRKASRAPPGMTTTPIPMTTTTQPMAVDGEHGFHLLRVRDLHRELAAERGLLLAAERGLKLAVEKAVTTRTEQGDDQHQDRLDQRDLRMQVHALQALHAGLATVSTDSLAVPFAAAPCSSWPPPM